MNVGYMSIWSWTSYELRTQNSSWLCSNEMNSLNQIVSAAVDDVNKLRCAMILGPSFAHFAAAWSRLSFLFPPFALFLFYILMCWLIALWKKKHSSSKCFTAFIRISVRKIIMPNIESRRGDEMLCIFAWIQSARDSNSELVKRFNEIIQFPFWLAYDTRHA